MPKKKHIGKGYKTDRQTDIATTRPTRPTCKVKQILIKYIKLIVINKST